MYAVVSMLEEREKNMKRVVKRGRSSNLDQDCSSKSEGSSTNGDTSGTVVESGDGVTSRRAATRAGSLSSGDGGQAGNTGGGGVVCGGCVSVARRGDSGRRNSSRGNGSRRRAGLLTRWSEGVSEAARAGSSDSDWVGTRTEEDLLGVGVDVEAGRTLVLKVWVGDGEAGGSLGLGAGRDGTIGLDNDVRAVGKLELTSVSDDTGSLGTAGVDGEDTVGDGDSSVLVAAAGSQDHETNRLGVSESQSGEEEVGGDVRELHCWL